MPGSPFGDARYPSPSIPRWAAYVPNESSGQTGWQLYPSHSLSRGSPARKLRVCALLRPLSVYVFVLFCEIGVLSCLMKSSIHAKRKGYFFIPELLPSLKSILNRKRHVVGDQQGHVGRQGWSMPAQVSPCGSKAPMCLLATVPKPKLKAAGSAAVISTGKGTRMAPKISFRRRGTNSSISMGTLQDVPLAMTSEGSVMFSVDSKIANTLSWDEPIRLKGAAPSAPPLLEPGSCNLYTFPKVKSQDSDAAEEPSHDAIGVLHAALLWLGKEGHLLLPDGVGAYPIHSLLVCNTPAALSLSMRMFEAAPTMLTLCHEAPHVYQGETSLHILAVNRHEDLLVRLVELAQEKLGDADLSRLLSTQAVGAFFHEPPMCRCAPPLQLIACVPYVCHARWRSTSCSPASTCRNHTCRCRHVKCV